MFIKNGVDINIRDRSGDSALHFVAAKGNAKLARVLLNGGANINIKNNLKETPYDIAVRNGRKFYKACKKIQIQTLF